MSLIRREVFECVGLLDEGFGMGYFEEIDLQLRARRRGFRACYVPSSRIVHLTAQSFKRARAGLKEELLQKNWLRLISIHFPTYWLILRIPLDMARMPLEIPLNGGHVVPRIRGWCGYLQDLEGIIARRRSLNRDGKLNWKELR